jgi:membrane protein
VKYIFRITELIRIGINGESLVMASALAFSTLLAIVPLVTVIFSTLSLFPMFEQWKLIVEQFVFANFVPATGEVVNEYLQTFSGQAGKLTAVGLATLLATSLMLLATIENSFNKMWSVNTGRSAGQRVLVYWALLTLGPILIIVSLAFTSYLLAESILGEVAGVSGAVDLLLPLLPVVLEFSSFLLLYTLVPNRPAQWWPAVLGAVIATVLFEVAKGSFSWYVSHFNSFEVIYGAVGVIPIFLIWIYISWLVILAGGRFSVFFENKSPSDINH